MAAALKAARVMARDTRLIAVLGHMAELGPIAGEEHERLGELAARLRVDRLVAFGGPPPSRSRWRRSARAWSPTNVAAYDEPDDALADVRAHARPGDVVLFKGSRVAGLETARGGAAVISILVAGAIGLAVTLLGTPDRDPGLHASGGGVSASARTGRTPTSRRWAPRRWAAS